MSDARSIVSGVVVGLAAFPVVRLVAAIIHAIGGTQ